MTFLKHNRSGWILGEGCEEPIVRLSANYRSKLPVTLSEPIYLGRQGLNSNEFTMLLTDQKILSSLETFFRGPNGNSFGKTHMESFNSRIFTEVAQEFPEADGEISRSIQLLSKSCPWLYSLFDKIILTVVPIYHEKEGRPFRRGSSHIDYLGLIFTSLLERKFQDSRLVTTVLAIDLAHEVGHQALMTYQLSDNVLASSLTEPVFSSIRRVERPAVMALHACVASAYMMEVCYGIQKLDDVPDLARVYCENTLAQLRRHQQLSLEAIRYKCKFTELGSLIMADLESQLKQIIQFGGDVPDNASVSYFGLLRA